MNLIYMPLLVYNKRILKFNNLVILYSNSLSLLLYRYKSIIFAIFINLINILIIIYERLILLLNN